MANDISLAVFAPEFRLSFPNLVIARKFKENGVEKGDPKFDTSMIFGKDSMTKFRKLDPSNADKLVTCDIREEAKALIKAKWPEMQFTDPALETFFPRAGWPFKSGDTIAKEMEAKKKDGSAYVGAVVINANSAEGYAPTLKTTVGKTIVQLSRQKDEDMAKAKTLFVGGHYAIAELNMKPGIFAKKPYIKFYLTMVRFTREGERFGGKGLSDRFDGIEGGESQVDPTQGMADSEIPY